MVLAVWGSDGPHVLDVERDVKRVCRQMEETINEMLDRCYSGCDVAFYSGLIRDWT